MQTLVAVLDGRKAAGAEVNWGREASPITDTRPKYERGRDILAEISGVPADAPKADYAVLAPEIEVFLKEHLFADLFERDVLTHAEREIATVAILAAIGGVEPMMKGHMGIALNVGVTPDELRGLLALVERRIGRSEADAGRLMLDEVLQGKGLTADPGTPVAEAGNGVRRQKVTFRNRFLIDVVGDLFLPAGYDPAKRYPTLVVGPSFRWRKGADLGALRRRLAESGYVTLAFDASYYGESGGYPRRIESPEVRVEDFSAAVDFLANHPAVDADRIGVIGICGGGCYSVSAAQIDHRIKAVATISMYDMGRARRRGVGDSMTYEQRMATLDAVGAQRTAEYGGAARRDIRALPEKVDASTPQYALDFLDYYDNPRTRQASQFDGLLFLYEPCADDEFLSVRADRDHLSAPAALHCGRTCRVGLLLGRRLREGRRTQGAVRRRGSHACRSLRPPGVPGDYAAQTGRLFQAIP